MVNCCQRAKARPNSVDSLTGISGSDIVTYNLIIAQSGVQPNYAYAGLHRHQTSGLYLATYRAYDPATARWIKRDPIKEAGGLNIYAYVLGNPIGYRDRIGNGPVTAIVGAAMGAAVGYATGGVWGAVVGGVAGGVVGVVAPWASGEAAALASGMLSKGGAAVVAATTTMAVNSAAAGISTMAMNKIQDKPIGEGVILAATVGAVAPAISGEAAAAGLSAVARNAVPRIGEHILGFFSNLINLTAGLATMNQSQQRGLSQRACY